MEKGHQVVLVVANAVTLVLFVVEDFVCLSNDEYHATQVWLIVNASLWVLISTASLTGLVLMRWPRHRIKALVLWMGVMVGVLSCFIWSILEYTAIDATSKSGKCDIDNFALVSFLFALGLGFYHLFLLLRVSYMSKCCVCRAWVVEDDSFSLHCHACERPVCRVCNNEERDPEICGFYVCLCDSVWCRSCREAGRACSACFTEE